MIFARINNCGEELIRVGRLKTDAKRGVIPKIGNLDCCHNNQM